MNKHLRKIHVAVDKLNAKEKTSTLPAPKTNKNRAVKPTPPDDENWRTYYGLCPQSVGFFYFLPAIFLPIAFIFYNGNHSIWRQAGLYYLALCIFLPLSNYLYLKIRIALGFTAFRKWRTRLPFELKGWEKWVDAPNFTKTTSWRSQASVEIVWTQNEKLHAEDVQAILSLFCQKANDLYYETDNFSDIRKKWTFLDNTAKGSLNNRIAHLLYLFILKELSPLAKDVKGISCLILDANLKEQVVRHASPSSD